MADDENERATSTEPETVTLLVGGKRHEFTPAQLRSRGSSFFGALMDHLEMMGSQKTEDGAYVLHRDPFCFETIANHLRHGDVDLGEKSTKELLALRQVADFDNLTDLLRQIERVMDERDSERARLETRVAKLKAGKASLKRRICDLQEVLDERASLMERQRQNSLDNARFHMQTSIPYGSIDVRSQAQLSMLPLCLISNPHRAWNIVWGVASPRGLPSVALIMELP